MHDTGNPGITYEINEVLSGGKHWRTYCGFTMFYGANDVHWFIDGTGKE